MGKYFIVDAPNEGNWEQMSNGIENLDKAKGTLETFKKVWTDKRLKIFQEVIIDEQSQ